MSTQARVAIVVLNWNGKEDVLECLRSLRHLDYPNYEIVVVDQNSSDGSPEAIVSEFPGAMLLCNKDNLGFAEGNNVGIRHALARGTDYIVLLNNDTTVEPNLLTAIVDAARKHPDFAVFGPKIVFDSDPRLIWAAGSHIDWRRGICVQQGYGEVDQGQYGNYAEVNALTACAMLISREVFETVGFLDRRFFIYYEETDWCARATAAGFRMLYVPHTAVRHKVSSAMGTSSPAAVFYFVRNNLLFISKNSRGLLRSWLLVKALLDTARTICSGLVKGRRKDALVRMRAVAAFVGRRFGKAEV